MKLTRAFSGGILAASVLAALMASAPLSRAGADQMESISRDPANPSKFLVECRSGRTESRTVQEVAADWYCLPASLENGVALFASGTYVSSSASAGMEAILNQYGVPVEKFTDLAPASLSTVLQKRAVLIFPSLSADLAPALNPQTKRLIDTFVRDGGVLMSTCASYDPYKTMDLVNGLFGWRMNARDMYLAVPVQKQPLSNALAAAFSSAAASLEVFYATISIDKATLPSGAIPVYRVAGGSYRGAENNPIVLAIPHGKGFVVQTAWNFHDAKPSGSQDGGWLSVVEAVAKLAQDRVAEPEPQPEPQPGAGSPGHTDDPTKYDDEF